MKRVAFAFGAMLVLAGVLLAVPVEQTVERSRTMAAPPAAVRAQLADFHAWHEWMKPKDMQRAADTSTFEDDGKVWRWRDRDGKAWGLKRVSLTDAQLVVENVDGRYTDTMTMNPEGTGTRVTWTHRFTLRGPAKLVPLIRSPDAVVGPALEEYLALLEKAAAQP